MEYRDTIVTSVITSPHWVGVFFAIAIATSFIPFFVGFFLGFSVASDIVFGVYALIGGVASYYVIKLLFRRKLVLLKQPEISFLMPWFVLIGYVLVFRPFE